MAQGLRALTSASGELGLRCALQLASFSRGVFCDVTVAWHLSLTSLGTFMVFPLWACYKYRYSEGFGERLSVGKVLAA